MNTSLLMPRLMYLLAGLAWVGLLWPSPTPVFLAGCLACLSMPLYRALRKYARRMRRRTELNLKLFLATNPGPATRFVHVRRQRIKLAFLHSFPIAGSFAVIFVSIAVPITIFMVLVAPQIGAGYARLKELWEHNFQLPPEWAAYLDNLIARFESMPLLARLTEELQTYLDTLAAYLTNFSTDTVTTLINNGFNVLGGTMNVLWSYFLCVALTNIVTS